MREAARQTMRNILLALNMPASEDTQNAVAILVETCWNNTENVEGEDGDAHRGTFAVAIVRIIRTNSKQRDSLPAHDIVRVGETLWADWQAYCEASKQALLAKRQRLKT